MKLIYFTLCTAFLIHASYAQNDAQVQETNKVPATKTLSQEPLSYEDIDASHETSNTPILTNPFEPTKETSEEIFSSVNPTPQVVEKSETATQPETISDPTAEPEKKKMFNGKEYDDAFYIKFHDRDDVDETVELALSWNGEQQRDHFVQMQHHIDSKDEYADYARQIIAAAQRLLDRSLKNAGYQGHIDIEDYVHAAYNRHHRRDIDNPELRLALQKLYDLPNDALERATDIGDAEREEWRMEHPPSYHRVAVTPE